MSVASALRPHPKRVMVVDDEQFVRTLCRRMLEDEGYEVYEAADGLQALAVLQERNPIDAVITDLRMPKMDGLALAACLVNQSPRIPILFISGFGQHHEVVAALGPLIHKPFSAEQLVEGVRQVLMPRAQSA